MARSDHLHAVEGDSLALHDREDLDLPAERLDVPPEGREAVVGRKTGDDRFYERNVARAERLWERYLSEKAWEHEDE